MTFCEVINLYIPRHQKEDSMLARDYMTKAVVTAHPDDIVVDVRKMMQQEGIRHVPVVEDGNLVGIVSLNSLRDAAPSKATDLSIHEVNFLLSKMVIRDVMKKEVVTCGPDAHVEDVARIMQTRRIGAMPVVDKGRVMGILTNDDMFRILMKILGMEGPGKRITMELERGRGELLVDIVKAVKSRGKFIKSLLSIESARPGRQTVILHLDPSEMTEVLDDLRGQGFDIQAVDEIE
jgi:acetoin utilization protein AcuB